MPRLELHDVTPEFRATSLLSSRTSPRHELRPTYLRLVRAVVE